MTIWKCTVCGYLHDGAEPPTYCPKCKAAAEKFLELSEDQSKLIERSRKTNQYHAELLSLLEQVNEVAVLGREDGLDPACVLIFQQAIEAATILRQAVKAEIAGHISKGKWG